MIYILDTNAFITLFKEGIYDINVFPTLWSNFHDLVKAGRIASVREVRHEIEKTNRSDDPLVDWVKQYPQLFPLPNNSETEFVKTLFTDKHMQGLIKHGSIVRGDEVADPFVIARAHDLRGCVVTQEKKKPNAPCIPNACEDHAIDCTDLIGLMQREGWKF